MNASSTAVLERNIIKFNHAKIRLMACICGRKRKTRRKIGKWSNEMKRWSNKVINHAYKNIRD